MESVRRTSAIRRLREERGLERHHLMAEFGVSESAVRRWEQGQGMTLDRLTQLADYFGVSTDAVLGRKQEKTAA